MIMDNSLNNNIFMTKSIVKYPEQSTFKPNEHLYSIELINKENNTNTGINVVNNNLNSSTFHFDRIFPENSSQQDVKYFLFKFFFFFLQIFSIFLNFLQFFIKSFFRLSLTKGQINLNLGLFN